MRRSGAPVLGAAPAAAVLAGLAVAALLATRTASVAVICALLLAAVFRAPAERRRLYLVGTLGTGLTVFLLTPFVEVIGSHPLGPGRRCPCSAAST